MSAQPDQSTPPGVPWSQWLRGAFGRGDRGGDQPQPVPGEDGRAPEQGTDRFTPDLAIGARELAAGAGWVAVLVVTGYPSEVGPAWLDPLLSYPATLDVSVHIAPVDAATAAARLRRQLARLEAGRRHTAHHGQLPEPQVEAATEDAHALASRLARGDARLFKVSLYLAVHAPDPETLADEVAAVRALAASMLLEVRPATWRQLEAFESCLPCGIDGLNVARVMDTDPVSAAFPLTSPDLPPADPARPELGADGVLYGHNLGAQGLVFHDRFTGPNYNAVILGYSGSGKSFHTKLEMLRYLFRRVLVRVLDPGDEYTRVTSAVGGVVVRVGAPGVTLNPLDLPIHVRPDGAAHAPPDAITRQALFVQTFVAVLLGEELDAGGRAVLDAAVTATYQRAGIHPDQPATWHRPVPLLADLAAVLRKAPDPAGPALAARLAPFVTGAHAGLFDAPTSTPAATSAHLVSYSLRDCPDQMRPVATLLVLERLWREVADPAHRVPRMVILDEAWKLMAQPSAAGFVWRMAKEFRKLYGALTFVSQDIADLIGSELGDAVINNSAMHVLFHQSAKTIGHIADAFGLAPGETAFVRRARVGEALICLTNNLGGHRVATRMVASKAEAELVTTDPAELAALADTEGSDPVTAAGYIHLTPPDPHPTSANMPQPGAAETYDGVGR